MKLLTSVPFDDNVRDSVTSSIKNNTERVIRSHISSFIVRSIKSSIEDPVWIPLYTVWEFIHR